jgi:hypothetical protein
MPVKPTGVISHHHLRDSAQRLNLCSAKESGDNAEAALMERIAVLTL